ncbi:MAG TPA: ribonuclease H-like domain-containing protein [Atribacteraceae bacterium]|nr:ribonuclease H-like domain-containing protein [Atribacteraceae bacterium]
MLRRTFCHIPGIGDKIEQRVWKEGILSWSDALWNTAFQACLPRGLTGLAEGALLRSQEHLENGNIHFFRSNLRHFYRWRLFPDFREKTVFLDIETTGIPPPDDRITLITLFDGYKIKIYIQGINLGDFANDIMQYQVIITFNGKCFDIPFIERDLDIRLPQVHLDLRFILKSLGLSGGLKICEKAIGIDRGDLAGVDGFTAVLLWQKYQEGCGEALETLIAYNVEDTVNLEKLMVYAYNRKVKDLEFSDLILPEPHKRIILPYTINREILNEIFHERLRRYGKRTWELVDG